MALPLPASNKVDTRTINKPANELIRAEEWNQLVQAVAELQSAGTNTYPVGSVPAPSAALALRTIAVTEDGQPTIYQVCLPNGAGGYEWRIITQTEA